mgnify:CR=1 FL=1
MNITAVVIESRGDVQPILALRGDRINGKVICSHGKLSENNL